MLTIISDESTRDHVDAVASSLHWLRDCCLAVTSNLAGYPLPSGLTRVYIAILSPDLLAYPPEEVIIWLDQDDYVPLYLLDVGMQIPDSLKDTPYAQVFLGRGVGVTSKDLKGVVISAMFNRQPSASLPVA